MLGQSARSFPGGFCSGGARMPSLDTPLVGSGIGNPPDSASRHLQAQVFAADLRSREVIAGIPNGGLACAAVKIDNHRGGCAPRTPAEPLVRSPVIQVNPSIADLFGDRLRAEDAVQS